MAFEFLQQMNFISSFTKFSWMCHRC